MYINKLTITSFYEKNKILMKTKINPDQELALQYIKDRVNARNEFIINIPERLRKQVQVPKMFIDNQNKTQAQHSTKSFIG